MTLEVDSGGFTAANIENNSIAMKTALNVFLFKCSSPVKYWAVSTVKAFLSRFLD